MSDARVRFNRSTKGLLAVVIALFLFFPTATVCATVTLDFVDVGQGDAILIRTAKNAVVLIDGGTEQAGRDVLVPHLHKLAIEHIDVIIATHPHADHIGGLIPVLATFSVGQVWADGQVHTTRTYERFLQTVLERDIPFYAARSGDSIAVAGLDNLRVLHPVDEFLQGLNNNSVVVRLSYDGVHALFTGDLEREGETEMLQRHPDIHSHILKVAHHGSNSSSHQPFLEAVAPQVGVIMAGSDNTYGHPHREVLERLDQRNIEILRTDHEGSIRIVMKDGGWERVPVDRPSVISIMRSTPDILQGIPGVGPVLAQRIVEWRMNNTPNQWEDLLAISGIGPATLETIREHAELH